MHRVTIVSAKVLHGLTACDRIRISKALQLHESQDRINALFRKHLNDIVN